MFFWILLIIVVLLARFTLGTMRSTIYDKFISDRLTTPWYRRVLERLPEHATLLDVGIGTAKALCNNKDLVTKKNIKVTGIDYDGDYITRAKAVVQDAGLTKLISVKCMSVYDKPLPAPPTADKYDAVYFSGSLTLMPDPTAALLAVGASLRAGGYIYVTQTFQLKDNPLFPMRKIKPLLKWVTSIDFGQLTFEKEIMDIVKNAGMEVVEYSKMQDGYAQTKNATCRLLIIKIP